MIRIDRDKMKAFKIGFTTWQKNLLHGVILWKSMRHESLVNPKSLQRKPHILMVSSAPFRVSIMQLHLIRRTLHLISFSFSFSIPAAEKCHVSSPVEDHLLKMCKDALEDKHWKVHSAQVIMVVNGIIRESYGVHLFTSLVFAASLKSTSDAYLVHSLFIAVILVLVAVRRRLMALHLDCIIGRTKGKGAALWLHYAWTAAATNSPFERWRRTGSKEITRESGKSHPLLHLHWRSNGMSPIRCTKLKPRST